MISSFDRRLQEASFKLALMLGIKFENALKLLKMKPGLLEGVCNG